MDNPATCARFRTIILPVALGLILTLLVLVLMTGPARAETIIPLPPITTTAGYLGTSYTNYETAGEYVAPLAYDAGSRWDRVDFNWGVLQPSSSSWNWVPYDDLVDRQTGYDFDVIGILMVTPSWAADTSRCSTSAQSYALPSQLLGRPSISLDLSQAGETYKCPPKGLYLSWDNPGNLWGSFVYTTVLRYKGEVDTWEMWNEPDMYTWFWTGSVADYARLLRVGYEAAKAANPDATVLFAGMAYWANPSYYVAVLDALKALPGASANNYYFDAMSLHLYSNVYQIGPVAAEIQDNMASRVGTHPIWLTETGAPLWDESASGPLADKLNRITAEETSAYVIQAFAESRAAGIEKFIFFRTNDADMSEYFGLIRNDLSLRPAYPAFQAVATYLYGENQITGPFTNDGVRRVTFWGTPRGRIDVLWNTTGAPIIYSQTAYLTRATIVTHRGQTSTLPAAGGRFTVTLESATANTGAGGAYLVGGSPILLIQQDTVAPASTLRPLPDLQFGAAVTLSLDVVDTGTGYWYAEIERASTPTGPWSLVAGLSQLRGTTTTVDTVPAAGRWYYRARTRDNAGNWEDWPSSAEVGTTVWLTRTVGLSVTAYLDENSDGLWGSEEVAATAASLTWRDGDGTTIAQTVGATWQVTRTVEAGQYTLAARVSDYIVAPYSFQVTAGQNPVSYVITLGLKPIVGIAYLPLIMHQP